MLDEKIQMMKKPDETQEISRVKDRVERIVMIFHRCLICGNAIDFDSEAMSMLTGENLMITFMCKATLEPDAYFQKVTTNPMILNLINGRCWADGSGEIPHNGCDNFVLRKTINENTASYCGV
jgi:hypothetical protein